VNESFANARPAVPPSRGIPGRSADLCHTAAMTSPRRISPRIPALLAFAGAATVILSACSSSATTTQPATAEPSPGAGNLGVRVCIVNNTSLGASVVFTTKDSGQDGVIPAGGRLCGEGSFGTGPDVEGNVSWANPAWQTAFRASNPWIGKPEARIRESFPGAPDACLLKDFDVNESLIGDNGILQTTITRLSDDQWKEFDIIFAPSNSPSPNGERRAGAGFRSCSGGPPAAS